MSRTWPFVSVPAAGQAGAQKIARPDPVPDGGDPGGRVGPVAPTAARRPRMAAGAAPGSPAGPHGLQCRGCPFRRTTTLGATAAGCNSHPDSRGSDSCRAGHTVGTGHPSDATAYAQWRNRQHARVRELRRKHPPGTRSSSPSGCGPLSPELSASGPFRTLGSSPPFRVGSGPAPAGSPRCANTLPHFAFAPRAVPGGPRTEPPRSGLERPRMPPTTRNLECLALFGGPCPCPQPAFPPRLL